MEYEIKKGTYKGYIQRGTDYQLYFIPLGDAPSLDEVSKACHTLRDKFDCDGNEIRIRGVFGAVRAEYVQKTPTESKASFLDKLGDR